jgi:hypothetical protein
MSVQCGLPSGSNAGRYAMKDAEGIYHSLTVMRQASSIRGLRQKDGGGMSAMDRTARIIGTATA